MGLTDCQIERYSRQIIVAGGIAQERLSKSRVVIAGEARDAETAVYYLAGAGIRHIDLILSGEPFLIARIAAHVRRLNSETCLALDKSVETVADLILAFITSGSKPAEWRKWVSIRPTRAPVIVVKAESPARIALIRSPQCVECTVENLLALPLTESDNSAFIALFASVEALKMLISDKPSQRSSLIEFAGYSTRTVNASSLPGIPENSCRHQRSGPVS